MSTDDKDYRNRLDYVNCDRFVDFLLPYQGDTADIKIWINNCTRWNRKNVKHHKN